MSGLFSYEGTFVRTVNKIIDIVCLSLVWIIFSLPVFTAGATSTALYYTVNKVFRQDNDRILRAFWHSFKSNFRQSTVIWIVLLVFFVVFGVNGYYGYAFYASEVMPLGILIVIGVVAALILAWACYLFPYIARFTNSTKEVLVNCTYMFARHFPSSVLLLVIYLGCVVAAACVPVGVLFAPAACAWLSNLVLEKIFASYMSLEDRAEQEAAAGIEA